MYGNAQDALMMIMTAITPKIIASRQPPNNC